MSESAHHAIARLRARQSFYKARERGKFFMGLPERWMDDQHYRCVNGHVSGFVIKSEAAGGDICPACGCPCVLTFPEDSDD